LGAETSRTINRDPIAEWQESILEIISVVAEVCPWYSICIIGKDGVNSRDAFWCKDIGYIRAEVEEVISGICWIPIKFLPCVRWVVQWSTNLCLLLACTSTTQDWATYLETLWSLQSLSYQRAPLAQKSLSNAEWHLYYWSPAASQSCLQGH
jgi:hypothetical protein